MAQALQPRAEGERDTNERLSPDDMATRREEEFLAAALREQAARAARTPAGVNGTCSNCGERCLPTAVYCDEYCRDDHERRLMALARVGR